MRAKLEACCAPLHTEPSRFRGLGFPIHLPSALICLSAADASHLRPFKALRVMRIHAIKSLVVGTKLIEMIIVSCCRPVAKLLGHSTQLLHIQPNHPSHFFPRFDPAQSRCPSRPPFRHCCSSVHLTLRFTVYRRAPHVSADLGTDGFTKHAQVRPGPCVVLTD